MPDDLRLPDIPLALLEYLDKLYPERSPDPSWEDRKVWIKTGERNVVRFLWAQYENIHKDQLPNVHPDR